MLLRISTFALLTLAMATSLQAQQIDKAPRPIDWKEFAGKQIDPSWILPERSRAAGGNFLQEMRKLASLKMPKASVAQDGEVIANFGDAVKIFFEAKKKGQSLAGALKKLEARHPEVKKRLNDTFRQLVVDDGLFKKSWLPESNWDDDGIYMAPTWDLGNEPLKPWSTLDGTVEVNQAAALYFADLDAIKAAENDYRSYPKRPGAEYEAIYAKRGSYVSGFDPKRRPFTALEAYFRQDLPFPFSDYECDLEIYNTLDSTGALATHVYSKSEDFYYLVGRDVFIPVRTSRGEWVGMLVARAFGFDLRGVPDDRDARQQGMRAGLGNLKRESEALFRKRGFQPLTIERAVPRPPVIGAK
jgi:hypothetical protein